MAETKVKEHPILFSAEMVKAILKGRKTQTRRVVKPQPEEYLCGDTLQPNIFYLDGNPDKVYRIPYQVGNRLWVRERFALAYIEQPSSRNSGLGDATPLYPYEDKIPKSHEEGLSITYYTDLADPGDGYWPSIFMPRWASRITLEITGVRVQRVQEISEEDAVTEGVESILWEPDDQTNKALERVGAAPITKPYPVGWRNYLRKYDGRYRYGQPREYPDMVDTARASYFSLWNLINAKRGYSWESNPWVWCLTFKRITP